MQHEMVMNVLEYRSPQGGALSVNPQVAVTIDTDSLPPHILLMRGTASVEIVDGVPDEFLQASQKVIPKEQWSGFEENARSMYPRMARITVRPEWAKLIDFETRFPSAVHELASRK